MMNSHIYKINNSNMNPDEPDYVFKTSKVMCNIALQMIKQEKIIHFKMN